jgi:hypothetical protein
MLSLPQLFDKELAKKDARGWEHIYVMVDLHDTIIPSSYSNSDTLDNIYNFALPTLMKLTERSEYKLILWTSSHSEYIESMIPQFKKYGVEFDYINENPEEQSSSGNFINTDNKFYFNVILDDKAGFDAKEDWFTLNNYLTENR